MKKTIIALALAGFAGSVSADALFYGGAMVGQSEYDDEKSTAASFHLGTGLLPILGIEAGYADHGEFDIDGLTSDVKADSIFAAVRPSLDLGPLHLYGRAGVHKWDMSGGKKDDGVDMMYGFGAEYFIFGPVSLGAAYNVYKTDDKDISNFSLSATFHFL